MNIFEIMNPQSLIWMIAATTQDGKKLQEFYQVFYFKQVLLSTEELTVLGKI